MDGRRLSVALPDEQIEAMQGAVAAGEYASASEIVREAVRDWQVKRALRPEELARLRGLWDAGMASGPARPLDFGKLRAEAQARLGKRRQGVA